MITTLERFDKVTAAGILARAALSIDGNPGGEYQLPDEADVRNALLREAMTARGIDPDDRRPETLQLLGDILDAELETLITPSNNQEVLERLSTRGELPSDLFEIEVVQQISDLHGARFPAELKLIEQTVRLPDREQHYGPHPSIPNEPFLVSLFFKYFPNEYPARSFAMLVAGQRHGLKLSVHHAWRIYPSDVNLQGAETLVDILRRFSDKFGVEVRMGDRKGKFILGGEVRGGLQDISVSTPTPRPGDKVKVSITCFWQSNPATKVNHAALVIGIDLLKYKKALKAHRGL